MMKLEFEWREAKAEANWRDHGVSFELAKTVFNDPFAVERSVTGRIMARSALSSLAWPKVMFCCSWPTPGAKSVFVSFRHAG